MPRLPNFFIIGAPKAGTTSIYHYLDQHPAVFMSAIKEPHFFADEIREEHCEPELRRRMARENRGAVIFSPVQCARNASAELSPTGRIMSGCLPTRPTNPLWAKRAFVICGRRQHRAGLRKGFRTPRSW